MRPTHYIYSAAILISLSACDIQKSHYTEPEVSGLIGGRAYPDHGHVCQVIGENSLTLQYLDDSTLLIGCPHHERGAISDRKAEGAKELIRVGDWILLEAPLR